MSRMPALGAALLIAVMVAPAPVEAFTPRTRAEIVRRAITLMPPSLQRQMRKHRRALYQGALEGTREGEGSGDHAADPGAADERLASSIGRVTEGLESRRPMRHIIREFGRIAHAASDLSFALNVGPEDPREPGFYDRFGDYVETNLPKIRITFDGFADGALERGDVSGFARDVASRARRDYESILRSYHPEGRDPAPQDFDDRSIAFAAASLGTSLAVTATARAWLYAWHEANGDLEGAPLFGTAGADRPFSPALQQAAGDADEHKPKDQEER